MRVYRRSVCRLVYGRVCQRPSICTQTRSCFSWHTFPIWLLSFLPSLHPPFSVFPASHVIPVLALKACRKKINLRSALWWKAIESSWNLKIHKLLYVCNCPDSLLTADHNMNLVHREWTNYISINRFLPNCLFGQKTRKEFSLRWYKIKFEKNWAQTFW